jgi:hypothetical protein
MSHEIELDKGILEKLMSNNKKTSIDTSLTKISTTTTTTTVKANKNEELNENDLTIAHSSNEHKIIVPIVQVINIQNIATTAALSKYNDNINTNNNNNNIEISSSSPSSSNEVEESEGNLNKKKT